MSKQAHTPGPWRFEYGEIRGAEDVQVNGWPKPVGLVTNASYSDRVCGDLGNPELPGPAANIRLIAAAPDLLEALKSIRQYANDTLSGRADGGPDDREWQRECVIECRNRARAAIAKAEGL